MVSENHLGKSGFIENNIWESGIDTQSLSSFLATAECGTRCSVIFDLEQEFLFFAPSEDVFYTFHALPKDQHIWSSRYSCEANVTAMLQMKQLSPEH